MKIEILRDENGFPLDEDGNIDWDLTSKEKQCAMDRWDKVAQYDAGFKKERKCNNAKRPKPRKKKR